MARVLWDHNGILWTEFMALGTTLASEVYRETLNAFRRFTQTKRSGILTSPMASFYRTTMLGPTLSSHFT